MIKFNDSAQNFILIPRDAAEKLLEAPEGCMQLYLYGKLCPETERDELMRRLSFTPARFAECIEYLQRSGLIGITAGKDTEITYSGQHARIVPSELYSDADYNKALQQLFGTRVLKPSDYRALYECTDVFGLPHSVVTMLAEYMIVKHGSKVPMSFITREAIKWVRSGIATMEDAQNYIASGDLIKKQISQVLTELGMQKTVTPEAENMYIRWSREWGLSDSAIHKGVRETVTRANSPSLAYLNKVLENYHNKQLLTAADIEKSEREFKTATENAKRMLNAAGIAKRVSVSDKSLYAKLRAWGMDDETILYAAERSKGYASPILVMEKITDEWHKNGITTLEAAKNAVAARKAKSDYTERDYADGELDSLIYDTLAEMDSEESV